MCVFAIGPLRRDLLRSRVLMTAAVVYALFAGASGRAGEDMLPVDLDVPQEEIDAVLEVKRHFERAQSLLAARFHHAGLQRLRRTRGLAMLLGNRNNARVGDLDRYIRHFESIVQLPPDARAEYDQVLLSHVLSLELSKRGDQRGAIEAMARALAIQERVLGRDSRMFRNREMLLARCYYRMGDYDQGNRLLVDVTARARKSAGADSEEVSALLIMHGLLAAEFDTQEFDYSTGLLRRGLRNLLITEPESSNCGRAFLALIEIACWRQNFAEASSLCERALNHARRWYPTTEGERMEIVAMRGRVSLLQGDYERARADLDSAIPTLEKLLGTDDETSIAALITRAKVDLALGDPARAEAVLRTALERSSRTATLTRVHADALRWLGEVHARRGDSRKAIDTLANAQQIVEETYGQDHRLVSEILAASVPLLRRSNDEAKAVEYERMIHERNSRLARRYRVE